MAVDLHIHTAASGDGEFSAREIMQRAKEAQLEAVAITDHDTVDSVEEAVYWGKKAGLEVIPGCEFSTVYQDKWFHILGYFIDCQHSDIQAWCQMIEQARQDNVDAQIARLCEAGFYIEKDKVLAGIWLSANANLLWRCYFCRLPQRQKSGAEPLPVNG